MCSFWTFWLPLGLPVSVGWANFSRPGAEEVQPAFLSACFFFNCSFYWLCFKNIFTNSSDDFIHCILIMFTQIHSLPFYIHLIFWPHFFFFNPSSPGWRDGLVVKRTSCSDRSTGFGFQRPHGSSQLSLTQVPGHLSPSGLYSHQTCRWCRYTCRWKAHVHTHMYTYMNTHAWTCTGTCTQIHIHKK